MNNETYQGFALIPLMIIMCIFRNEACEIIGNVLHYFLGYL